MMRSLFSGVSGLKNHQTRMDVIGNNISNVNTTGFKSSRVTFADTLNQTMTGAAAPNGTIGGTNPKQVGLGSAVSSIDLLFTDGSVQSTGKNTDLCLSGNGLFVISNGSQTYYTRNGAFEFDAEGNYTMPGSGLLVQGWMGTDGVVNTNSTAGNIKIPAGKSMVAKATDTATYANNLNSEALTITAINGDTTAGKSVPATTTAPATLTMSDGTTVTQTGGTYTVGWSLPVTTTLTVYDSLGSVHSLPVYFAKSTVSSATGNSWTVSIDTNTANNTYTLEDGTVVTMAATTVDFTTSGKYDTAAGRNTGGRTAVLTLSNGSIGTQNVTLDLTSLTQFAGNNTVNGTTNGNAAGTLESISIDSSGIITGTYTNGVKQSEAQVAVAQFTNAAGLTKTGSSLYQESNNSGTANVKTAADLGVKITASALEMSNVDIANEFADMIITQRGFQSNSKMITVGDEMLETVINMKR